MDDGFQLELVADAFFDGILQIPIIKKEISFVKPSIMVPFSERKKTLPVQETMVVFYENDSMFGDFMHNPTAFIPHSVCIF